MKQKKAVSILCLVLAVIMILSLVISVLPARAYAVTQSDIDALKAKRAEITARKDKAQETLDELKEEESNVLVQKNALDEKYAAAQEALQLVGEEIEMYNGMIAEKETELQAALAREQGQLERYRQRVRAMEENGGYNLIGLLISADNFTDLLTTLDDVGEIMESDKTLEREYRAARQDVERVKAEYEEVRADCEEKQAGLEAEKAQLEADIAETEATLVALAEDIADAVSAFDAEAAAEAEMDEQVRQLIAQYEEEQRRAREEAARRAAEAAAAAAAAAAAQQQQGGTAVGDSYNGYTGYTGGGTVVGGESVGDSYSGYTGYTGGGGTVSSGGGSGSGGSFIWPVPCSHRISSGYGNDRGDHFHAGIDIDGYGNDGAPVIAAGSGTVILASYNGGYGECVMIDHGSGYVTLYGHLSGYAVSSGQYVSQGQTIGYLGSTGNSTGTHCHFEIRVNGSTVNPSSYVS